MGDPKKVRFSKLDQRIYNSVTPRFYGNALWRFRHPENREQDSPAREEIWKYALGSDDPLTKWETSPYKPSISTEEDTQYLRLKGLTKDSKKINRMLELLVNIQLGEEVMKRETMFRCMIYGI